VIPRVNLVRNIGFDALGTNTVERDFAGHAMHEPGVLKFPLHEPAAMEPEAARDDRVFETHYRVLEGRRNLWQKIWDRIRGSKCPA